MEKRSDADLFRKAQVKSHKEIERRQKEIVQRFKDAKN